MNHIVTYRRFQNSVDLLDIGAAISDIATHLHMIGRRITLLNDPPSRETLDTLAECATRILAATSQLRTIQ